ncbi:MAG: hypothetical protein ACREU1_12615 [Burkholderiales bacterium]
MPINAARHTPRPKTPPTDEPRVRLTAYGAALLEITRLRDALHQIEHQSLEHVLQLRRLEAQLHMQRAATAR